MTRTYAVTLEQQERELRREIAMRERVYPKWISGGTLQQEKALLQLAYLKAALETIIQLQDMFVVFPDTQKMKTIEVTL